jgi:hypothetical protein
MSDPRPHLTLPSRSKPPTLCAPKSILFVLGEYTLLQKSVYSFWREVYTLFGAKCIPFYRGRVYTFWQKCRGLRPRVSGIVPRSVGGCAEEGLNLSRQGILTAMAMRLGADGGCGIVSNARNGNF